MPMTARSSADLQHSLVEVAPLASVTDGGSRPSQAVPARMDLDFHRRYHIGEKVGAGAMGVVVRAVQLDLHREVAIKFFTCSGDLPSRRQAQRFEREARVLAALDHPNILRVFDHGRAGHTQYLVTELCRPDSLRSRMYMEGRASLAEVIRVVIPLLEALEHVHSLGVVHRDVKPENVLFAADGSVRLADFGLAHAPMPGRRLTRKSEVPGTMMYLPPELFTGESHGPASDLYAVATILYELVTGRHPFGGSEASDHLQLKLAASPPPVREVEPCVPAGLARLVDRALDRDPAARPASARALRESLLDLETRPQVPSRRRRSPSLRARRSGTSSPPRTSRLWLKLVVSLALGVAVGMVAVVHHALRPSHGPSPVCSAGREPQLT